MKVETRAFRKQSLADANAVAAHGLIVFFEAGSTNQPGCAPWVDVAYWHWLLWVLRRWSPQPQSVQLYDPLEVRKQHLHFLSIFARLFVETGFRDGTSNIACRLMNAAMDFANRCARATA
jgi:hypothetical protein